MASVHVGGAGEGVETGSSEVSVGWGVLNESWTGADGSATAASCIGSSDKDGRDEAIVSVGNDPTTPTTGVSSAGGPVDNMGGVSVATGSDAAAGG
jgi:hypothetical protein